MLIELVMLTFLHFFASGRESTAYTAELCVHARPNTERMYGHTLLYYRDQRTNLTLETQWRQERGGVRSGQAAKRRMRSFLSQGRAATTCYLLSPVQQRKFWAVVGETPAEIGKRITAEVESYHVLNNNCVAYSERIFEAVTGEDLKVRGLTHVGVESPTVLTNKIRAYSHAFQRNGRAWTFLTNTSLKKHLGL